MRTSPLCVFLALSSLASFAGAQTYSLSGGWSDAANPNGAWACLGGASYLSSVGNWAAGGFPFTQPAWAYAGSGAGHIPAWFKLAGTPSGLDAAAGNVLVHSWDPANGAPAGEASITWTAPAAGFIDISGGVWMGRDIGRSNDWSLFHNAALLRTGTVSSGDVYSSAFPFAFAAGAGTQPLSGRTVAAGDAIALSIIRSPSSFFGDFTAVDLTITLFSSPGSCSAGGFPASLLTVNGSDGAPSRNVHVGVGQPFTIAFAQPPGVPFAAPFAIFGRLGVPPPAEAYTLPLGIGTMCFAPSVLDPANPALFLLADSFGNTGIVPATPAPWALPVPGLPFPFVATLQGVTYHTASTFAVTNGLVLAIY